MLELEYAFLGLIQGLAEWLPISSKSQVILAATALGISGTEALRLSLFLHVGTFFAALVYFWKEVASLVGELAAPLKEKTPLFKHLFFSTLATAAIGVPLFILFRKSFDISNSKTMMLLVGIGLVATALLLRVKAKGLRSEKDLNWKDWVFTGLVQGLCVLPGVSRSGTSTASLLWRGVSQEEALRLSFLMSLPVVGGAEIAFNLLEGLPSVTLVQALVLVGSAFVSGYLAIGALMKIARSLPFSWFCALLGLVAVAAALV